jgi:hypothetical protein
MFVHLEVEARNSQRKAILKHIREFIQEKNLMFEAMMIEINHLLLKGISQITRKDTQEKDLITVRSATVGF